MCVCLPLGDNRVGGPSINVGGERKGLVSDAGRPRGDGPYGDLSARGERKLSESKVKEIWGPSGSTDLLGSSATGYTISLIMRECVR